MKILDFSAHHLYTVSTITRDINRWFKNNSSKYDKIVLIVTGDYGFGQNNAEYYQKHLSALNQQLQGCDSYLLLIRGNNDDPSYFSEDKLHLSNIIPLEDYSVVKTKSATTLCIGGAISTDRIWRKNQENLLNRFSPHKKKLYWENEAPIFNSELINELNEQGIKIDSVISHIPPLDVYPLVKPKTMSYYPWNTVDATLIRDIKQARTVMNDVLKSLIDNNTIKFWVYGHYMHYHQELKDNIAYILASTSCFNPVTVYDSLTMRQKQPKKLDSYFVSFSHPLDDILADLDAPDDNAELDAPNDNAVVENILNGRF